MQRSALRAAADPPRETIANRPKRGRSSDFLDIQICPEGERAERAGHSASSPLCCSFPGPERDVRRLLPALAVAQAAGVLAADRGWLGIDAALALGIGACALALAARRRPRAQAALALAAAAGGGALALAVRLESADASRPLRPVEATLEATVLEVAAAAGGAVRVELGSAAAVEPGASVPARVRVWLAPDRLAAPGLERALPGERIRARVRLAAPDSRRNPGSADGAARARRAGIGAVGRLVHPLFFVRVPE